MSDLEEIERFLDKYCRPDVIGIGSGLPINRHSLTTDHTDDRASSTSFRGAVAKKPRKAREGNSIFLTNLPLDSDIGSIKRFVIDLAGLQDSAISQVHIGIDKLNSTKPAGWCIVGFDSQIDLDAVVGLLDYHTFGDRCVYASVSNPLTAVTPFRLPEELVEQLKTLVSTRELNYSPAGRLADSYRRTYGTRFPFEVYGFKSFTAALQSIPGVEIVTEDNLATLHWKNI